jgi:hypothetical protein
MKKNRPIFTAFTNKNSEKLLTNLPLCDKIYLIEAHWAKSNSHRMTRKVVSAKGVGAEAVFPQGFRWVCRIRSAGLSPLCGGGLSKIRLRLL